MKKQKLLEITSRDFYKVDNEAFWQITFDLGRKLRGKLLRKPPAAVLAPKVDAVIYVPDGKEKRHGRTAQEMA